ncbi:MAG: hypothetical protein ACREPB_07270 [Arenimonas sp.]
MINRFHNAVSPVPVSGTNSQANKTKAGDGFALLLNALTAPVEEQQAKQHSAGLLQEPSVKLEPENAAMPFNRFVDLDAVLIGVSATPLFLTNPIPGPMAIVPPESLQASTQTDIHLPKITSPAAGFAIPVTSVPSIVGNEATQISATDSVEIVVTPVPLMPRNEVADTASPSKVIEIPSELFVIVEPTDIGNLSERSVTNGRKLPTPDITEAHATISKHVVMQGADVELVAMPWRLQANAAMSYQSTSQQLKNIGEVQSGLTATVQRTFTHVVDKNQLPILSIDSAQYEGIKIDRALEFYRVSEAASTLANAFESTRSLRADSRASLIMWPQRVLHWLADGDATTAWVRDYQLDASGTRTLVDALRCFAEQQDFSLRRIMLNGHEVWRSPSTF